MTKVCHFRHSVTRLHAAVEKSSSVSSASRPSTRWGRQISPCRLWRPSCVAATATTPPTRVALTVVALRVTAGFEIRSGNDVGHGMCCVVMYWRVRLGAPLAAGLGRSHCVEPDHW